jgi:hypothetical protein
MAKLKNVGTSTRDVEVCDISREGFTLNLAGRRLFVPFVEFPWFEKAPIEKVVNVEWSSLDQLYWPDLDIDLSIESIEHPERFPLLFDPALNH